MIKRIMLFFIYLISGLSLFMLNYYIRESRYGINNLNFFLLMISILLVALSFKNLFKTPEDKNTEKEKRNNIKAIIYVLMATIVFLITACYDYGKINLMWSKTLIVVFFIGAIIRSNYKIELYLIQSVKDIKEEIEHLTKSTKNRKGKKKKNKKPIIYILFDYIPIEFILLGVMIVHLEIGTFLLNMGIGNILPSYDIYYSEYEMAYITLGFVPMGRIFYLYMLYIM